MTGEGDATTSNAPTRPPVAMRDLTLNCGYLTTDNLDVWQTHLESMATIMGCADALTNNAAGPQQQHQAKMLMMKNVTDVNDVSIFKDSQLTAKGIFDRLKASKAAGSGAHKALLVQKESHLAPQQGESLQSFVDRAKELYNELKRAGLLDEERFLLRFLESMGSIQQYSAWSQTIDTATATFQKVATNLLARNLARANQPLKGSARSMNESSALNVTGSYCDFCERAGHTEAECRNRQRAKQELKQRNAQRKKNNRGKPSGKNAHANSTCFFAVNAVSKSNQDTWLIDSGCTDHMTNDFDALHNVSYMDGQCTLANKQKVPVCAKGDISLRNDDGTQCTLKDVLYVPDLHVNLISLSKAHKAGIHYSRTQKGMQLKSPKMTLNSTLKDDLFVVNCAIVKKSSKPFKPPDPPTLSDFIRPPDPPAINKAASSSPDAAAAVCLNAATLWHRRFGHKGFSTLADMASKNAVTGLPEARFFRQELKSVSVCEPCAEGKMKRNSFPSAPSKASKPLQMLHVDIATGLPPSASGACNYVIIVDDFTGFVVCGIIAAKSDAPDFVFDTIAAMKNKYAVKHNVTVASLRSDRDSVFMSKTSRAWMRANGVEFQPTSGHSPQENGHAERAIRTIGETMQAMLSDSGLPNKLWAECLRHAVYLTNIASTDGATTPWELLKNEKPDVSSLHIWGCTVWVNVPKALRRKGQLPPKARVGKFLGFDQPNLKAYRVLLPNGKVTTSRDVLFDESTPPASAATDDLFDDLMLPNPPAQQPPAQQPAAQQPTEPQPEEQQLEEQSQDDAPDSQSDEAAPPNATRIPSPVVRRSSRENLGKPPDIPYNRWLTHPESNHAASSMMPKEHFTLVGSLLSPHP